MLRMQERTFSGFKFQKFSGRLLPQTSPLPFMRGILVTHVAFSHCYPSSNILSHRKVPFQKMPPHGKILKKGPGHYNSGIKQTRVDGLTNKTKKPW
jgi:hypothetical protein